MSSNMNHTENSSFGQADKALAELLSVINQPTELGASLRQIGRQIGDALGVPPVAYLAVLLGNPGAPNTVADLLGVDRQRYRAITEAVTRGRWSSGGVH